MRILLTCCLFLFQSVYSQTPIISLVSPISGPVGTSVTISGNNFSTNLNANIVYFGAAKATVLTASTTTLTVTVPAGTSFQPITVTTAGLTGYAAQPFNITFNGSANISSTSFSAQSDQLIMNNPFDAIISDIDGDGKNDLVVESNILNTVSVYRNNGTTGLISFADPVTFNTGAAPYQITVADIDGDGMPDIISANSIDNNISIFRNTSIPGNISFASKIDFATGPNPRGVAVADVNGDGKQDIAVFNYDNSALNVSIFKNTGSIGNITFAAKTDIPAGYSSYSVILFDIDTDGKPDIIAASRTSAVAFVIRNTSNVNDVSFAPKLDFVTGSGSRSFTVADVDGDSKPELVVANYDVATFSVLKNTSTPGNISFNAKIDYITGTSPRNINVGELNGDGKPDIVVSNSGSNTISLYKNTSVPGAVSFSNKVDYSTGTGPRYAAVADLDGGGFADIVIVNQTSGTIAVYRNTMSEPYISTYKIESGCAVPGAIIRISGKNFTGVNSVKFGSQNALSFSLSGDTVITATVGNARLNTISVVSPAGTNAYKLLPPVLNSFSPANALSGQPITIKGNNLCAATSVSFGGIEASSFNIIADTMITAVPNGGASGNITVTNTGGTASIAGFVFNQPIINSFSPIKAPLGAVVTIYGKYFTGTSSVSFGGVAATAFTVVNDSIITATVGIGSSGSITVTTVNGIATIPGFIHASTLIKTFSPSSATAEVTISIVGNNFTGVTAVSFGGTEALSFKILSDTLIEAIVGEGTSGNITVTGPGGIATLSGFNFIGKPVIQSFTPLSGLPGSSFTITGYNFNTNPANNIVFVGCAKATVIAATATSLIVTVPKSTAYCPITVSNNSLTGYSVFPFIAGFTGGKEKIVKSTYVADTVIDVAGDRDDLITTDFDGDGLLDVAMPNRLLGSVSVLKNNTLKSGSITFAPKKDISVGGNTTSAFSYDIDNDGRPDIAAVNSASFTVSILRNTSVSGNISFASKVDFPVYTQPFGMCMADFDNDGRVDIANANLGSNKFTLLRNLSSPGTISFSLPIDIPTAAESVNIVAGDIDMDGKTDLLASINGRISIFRNLSTPGNFIFASPIELITIYPSSNLILGDMDGDNKTDIAITSYDYGYYKSASVAIFQNTSTAGNISFAPKIELNAPYIPDAITMADINGDAKADLLVAGEYDYVVKGYLNNSKLGSISFSDGVEFSIGKGPSGIAAADFDGDSKPEIISADANTLTVLRNRISEPYIQSFTPDVADSGVAVKIMGNNFTGTTAVSFGGNPARQFTVLSDTVISAVTGNGYSGKVVVVSPNGTANLDGFNYTGPIFVNSTLCSPVGNTVLTAYKTGSLYFWEINTGTGYTKITDGENFAGANTSSLQLINIPSSWYGYSIRSNVNNIYGNPLYKLQFTNTWTGAINSNWENPGNWSCGSVPDANTDVTISFGNIIVNSNVIVRSLILNPNVQLTLNSPNTITITH